MSPRSVLHVMTYDIECVITAQTRAAHCYALLQVMEIFPSKLAVATVAFTIQLAIDVSECDATAMCDLEKTPISKLAPFWEFDTVTLSADVQHGKPWAMP